MNILQGVVRVNLGREQLINSVEIASASLRRAGKEADAVSLFRLRARMRQGLSYEEAKPIFEKLTQTLFGETS